MYIINISVEIDLLTPYIDIDNYSITPGSSLSFYLLDVTSYLLYV